MLSLNDYKSLKNKVDSLQREADEETGAYNNQMKTLKNEFSCKDIEAAKKLDKQLEKEIEGLDKEAKEAIQVFEKKLEANDV